MDMVPSVTTIGGSRSFQTSRPLNAPNKAPADQREREHRRDAGIREGAIEERREHAAQREIRRDRQIDAAHQDDQHLPERQHDQDRGVVEQSGEIARRREARERERHRARTARA